MKLIIVESPAKAKTISKYVSAMPEFKDERVEVRASIGHVRDLPKSNKHAIDIEAGFVPHYEIAKGKDKVIADLSALSKKADGIILATDPDREGEAIAWHLYEALSLPASKTKRVTFNEITKEAIQEAIRSPRDIDQNLRKAQEARRVLDRLVGYDLSGLIWKKVRYGLSAGRVQSPALRIIMEREREIRAFIPEDYFVLEAILKANGGSEFTATCSVEPKTAAEADDIITKGTKGAWHVKEIKETDAARAPKPPFTTSTLQQVASTRLGFSPSRTMGAAQKLYEAGHITYMRTDSPALSSQARNAIGEYINNAFGKKYHTHREYSAKSKNAQEAHEAVRPTTISVRNAGDNEDQTRLYDLIWKRTVASQMTDALMKKTRLAVTITDEAIPDFVVNGSRILFDGWMQVDPAARTEEVEIPPVKEGESLSLIDIHKEAKQTQPPGRYSEAGLIKELEKRGIGRPSTYASIIKTLGDRGYVEKQGRTLMPTITGDVVSSFLETHFPTYISDTFTAEMEDELDDIADGKRSYEKTLKDFYTPFTKEVESKADIEKQTSLGKAPEEFVCPKCGAAMEYKLSKNGTFMSCVKFPECDGARTQEGKEITLNEPIGIYPETGEPIYLMDGRFGAYVQVGDGAKKEGKKKTKPKRASVPADYDLASITLKDALKFLSLPRVLGNHPETGEAISASVGKFGPFIVHQSDFRSLKEDDVYTIELPRALEILSEPKQRRGAKVAREIGAHPKTGKQIKVFTSKQGYFLKRGFTNVYLPKEIDIEALSVEQALEYLKKK